MLKKLLTFYILLFFTFDVIAQWTTDVYTNTPICTSIYKQREVRLDSDSDGGAFIVWRDYRSGTSLNIPDIYIQKVDSNGVAEWTINGAEICVLPSNQSTPALIKDGKGGVIVAWTDRRTGIADIYAQRIDKNGNILWNANGVPVVEKAYKEHSPKIISDDHSGAILVWEDLRVDSTFDIWAQRIDSNGNTLWQNGGISVCLQDSNRINHKVQRDGDGGAIITWQDQRNGEGDYDIYAQHLDADGNYLWSPQGVAVCVAPGNQINPKIDPEKKADGVFIGWQDLRNGLDYDIYCNRIDSNGVALWGVTGKPVVQAVNNQSAIDILSNNKTEGVIFTWKDKRANQYDIYCQKLDLNGNPEWQSNGVPVCTASGDQLNPNIISDKNGGAIIVWQDERGTDFDIYCQRVSYNGNTIWKNNGEAICLAVGDQTGPKNVPDNKGGLIVAWEDKRNVSKDIYIHHLLFEDTVTYPIDTPITSIKTLNSTAFRIYPNPTKGEFIVETSVTDIESIQVIDIQGREMMNVEIINDAHISMDITNLNKGSYFVLVKTKEGIFVEKVILN